MDVLKLRERLVGDYGSYVGSFIWIKDDRVEEEVRRSLDDGVRWPEPLIQLNPSFEAYESINKLVNEDVPHEECARTQLDERVEWGRSGTAQELRRRKNGLRKTG